MTVVLTVRGTAAVVIGPKNSYVVYVQQNVVAMNMGVQPTGIRMATTRKPIIRILCSLRAGIQPWNHASSHLHEGETSTTLCTDRRQPRNEEGNHYQRTDSTITKQRHIPPGP